MVWLSAPFYAKMLGPLYLSDIVPLLHLYHYHLLCVCIVLAVVNLGRTSGHRDVILYVNV